MCADPGEVPGLLLYGGTMMWIVAMLVVFAVGYIIDTLISFLEKR